MRELRFQEGVVVLYQGKRVTLEEYMGGSEYTSPDKEVWCHIIYGNGSKEWVKEADLDTALDRLADQA